MLAHAITAARFFSVLNSPRYAYIVEDDPAILECCKNKEKKNSN